MTPLPHIAIAFVVSLAWRRLPMSDRIYLAACIGFLAWFVSIR